jgi:hypothetical protein
MMLSERTSAFSLQLVTSRFQWQRAAPDCPNASVWDIKHEMDVTRVDVVGAAKSDD